MNMKLASVAPVPAVTYAIGDIHGRHELPGLAAL